MLFNVYIHVLFFVHKAFSPSLQSVSSNDLDQELASGGKCLLKVVSFKFWFRLLHVHVIVSRRF